MQEITVKEVLTFAHFDAGLVVLRSPAVVSVLPDLHRKKTTTKDKHKKTPKCFMFYNTKNHISYLQ